MRKRATLVTVLFWAALALPFVAVAADGLRPEVREVFDKGLAAAGQKEWIVAADSFQKAWKINKQTLSPERAEPEIVFNWGLAESKIPGRELRAMACFNLYLYVAKKEAANIEAVRKEKVLLEVREEARLRQLFAQAKKFAARLQGDEELRRRVAAGGYDLNGTIASLRRRAFRRVARAQARAGDFVGAAQTAELCKIPPQVNFATSAILFFDEYAGIDRTLVEDISKMQAEAEKPGGSGGMLIDLHLRDLLLSSHFSKASLTDPAGALQALADRKKPEDLFDGYMQVIEDRVFVLRRAAGQRSVHVSD